MREKESPVHPSHPPPGGPVEAVQTISEYLFEGRRNLLGTHVSPDQRDDLDDTIQYLSLLGIHSLHALPRSFDTVSWEVVRQMEQRAGWVLRIIPPSESHRTYAVRLEHHTHGGQTYGAEHACDIPRTICDLAAWALRTYPLPGNDPTREEG